MSGIGDVNTQLENNTKYLEIMDKMMSAVNKCLGASGNHQALCAKAAMQKYLRKLPLMNDLVYPWSNYNWDYETVVTKEYNPKDKGASDAGTITALIGDIEAMLHLLSGFLKDANPSSSASAGNPKAKQNDLVPCIQGKINSSCAMLNKMKDESRKQSAPYPDSFFTSNPTKGEGSSSFFVQVGFCPTKIATEKECKGKGYDWTPNPLYESTPEWLNAYTPAGTCSRKKYAYIDNRPGLPSGGLKDFKGLIPSLANDALNLAPDNIMAAAMGVNVPGFNSQKCTEGFQLDYKARSYLFSNSSVLLLCIVVVIFTLHCLKIT